MEFNEKLQQLRKQNNLTQEELAERLYVSRTAISKWESGRGYPSIDSLKMISRQFSVRIDDLLSSDELITIAESDQQEKARSLCDLVFGIMDCMVVMLFFVPFFGQPGDGRIDMVSLLNYSDSAAYMKVTYGIIAVLTAVFGILELALQNLRHQLWTKNRLMVSVLLSVMGTWFFIASRQPYAAGFWFFIVLLKGALLAKQR